MRAAYRRYLDARDLSRPVGAEWTPAELREMQLAMLDALRSGEPLPDEMRLHLAFAFEYLCDGITFDLLTPIKRPGGREPPIAKRTQDGAIRYLRWCEDGRIADAAAVRTVAAAYGVRDRTVRLWRTAWAAKPAPTLHEDYGTDEVAEFMRIDGRAYRRFVKKPKGRLKP